MTQQYLNLLPPSGNTGENCQIAHHADTRELVGVEYGIDAITLLWDKSEGCRVLEIVSSLCMLEIDFSRYQSYRVGVMWDRVHKATLGCLYMERSVSPDLVACRLSLSGQICNLMGLALIHRLLESLYANCDSLRCSRLDIRCDDYERRLRPDDILLALQSKNYSGFGSAKHVESFGPGGGWSFMLGSRESESAFRIYDKEAESCGRVRSIRLENEYKGSKSDQLARQIAGSTCVVEVLGIVRGNLLGRVNFVEKKSSHLDRNEYLSWWHEFLEYLGSARSFVSTVSVRGSVDGKIQWIRKQVEKSLATISMALGEIKFDEFIATIISSGKSRMRRFDDLIIAEWLHLQSDILVDSCTLE